MVETVGNLARKQSSKRIGRVWRNGMLTEDYVGVAAENVML